MTPKMCDGCKKPCQLLVSNTRPESSEWYCEKCHLSYEVDPRDLRGIVPQEMRRQ